MGGTGPLTVSGNGALTLTGKNTFTGRTTIRSNNALTGTVITDSQGQSTGSLPATGTFIDEGTLTFAQGSNGIFSGNIAGNGFFVINGSVGFAPNSHISTDIQIGSNGEVTGSASSLTGNIANNGFLTFNQPSTGTYAGIISGPGSVTKTGSGTLLFTEDNTYTGPTEVKEGLFGGSGSLLQSAVTVDSGATVFGTLGMKDLIIQGGGHLFLEHSSLPPSSPSLLSMTEAASAAIPQVMSRIRVTDNVNIMPGAFVNAKVAGNNLSSELTAKNIQLNGTFDLTSVGPRRAIRDKLFTILAANGKIQGRFANLISSDRLKYSINYTNNAVQVFVLPLQDFTDAFPPGNDSNAEKTAVYFDTFADSTTPGTDLRHMVLLLDGLLLTGHTAAVENAFNQIQPSQYKELGQISFLQNELVNRTV
ncbi:MAG: autotransporter-associated beta strand repeat-containing protein, partial [Alphaproteobacteria bacterium]|nr:autotransporter-associated beta strand repeat-containing protein [Alphaproteobacteria bacterium]